MDYVLNVEPRTQVGRAVKHVRAEGLVPANLYGQGNPATAIQFKQIDLVRLMRQGAASQLIELHGLGKKPKYVLLREVQRHPTRRTMLHVDFYEVQMDVVIRTEVPVHYTGESFAVKEGAVLIHYLDTIEIECLPRAIPEAFQADLSKLETIDDVIKVSDLPIPEGVEVLQDPDSIVVSLTLPQKPAEDEEEGEELEEGVAEPEVISSRGEEE
ncbi:MAG: 50S ribosomal protein L25 [Chloroflexi bacterium]|nr:50S ribosomal protein L25 [Chloroflexota bacterium]